MTEKRGKRKERTLTHQVENKKERIWNENPLHLLLQQHQKVGRKEKQIKLRKGQSVIRDLEREAGDLIIKSSYYLNPPPQLIWIYRLSKKNPCRQMRTHANFVIFRLLDWMFLCCIKNHTGMYPIKNVLNKTGGSIVPEQCRVLLLVFFYLIVSPPKCP